MKRHEVLLELCNSHTKYLHNNKQNYETKSHNYFILNIINFRKLLTGIITKFPIPNVNKETHRRAIWET